MEGGAYAGAYFKQALRGRKFHNLIPIIANARQNLEELDKMDFNEGFFYPDFEHFSDVICKRYSKNQLVKAFIKK
jgi:hypothetical protein